MFRTPPASTRRRAVFMEPTSRITPYEDVYGKRTEPDEFDVCEDETESEDDDTASMEEPNASFSFRPFSTPASRNSIFGRFATPARSQAFAGPETMTADSGHNNNTTSSLHDHGSEKYTISPSANPRRSVATTLNKKLTPRKFGFFASPASSMNHTNTAGDGMDDLLRAGSMANLDDGFPTLEGEDDYEKLFPATKRTLMFGQASSSKKAAQIVDTVVDTVMADASTTPQVTDDPQSAVEADVEDNAGLSNTNDVVKKGRPGRPRSKKLASGVVAARQNKFEAPPTPASGRYATRRQDRIAKEQEEDERMASRRSTRTQSRVDMLKASNRNKMTARAATMHKKAKKKAANTGTRQTRAQTEERKLQGVKGFVVVADNVDPAEYIRC